MVPMVQKPAHERKVKGGVSEKGLKQAFGIDK